jgi:hypothetical protein
MQTIESRSLARRFFSPVIFVTLAVAAGPLLAQTADRPEVKVGDKWRFVVSEGGVKSDCAWAVTSVTPVKIEGTENGKPLTLTADLNVIDSTGCATNDDIKDSERKFLNFPLEVGKKWSFTKKWPWHSDFPYLNAKVAVAGYEKVQVAAGEFDAFKVEAKFVWMWCCAPPTESNITYWYAPAARAIVRFEYRDSYYPSSTTELAEFELQP